MGAYFGWAFISANTAHHSEHWKWRRSQLQVHYYAKVHHPSSKDYIEEFLTLLKTELFELSNFSSLRIKLSTNYCAIQEKDIRSSSISHEHWANYCPRIFYNILVMIKLSPSKFLFARYQPQPKKVKKLFLWTFHGRCEYDYLRSHWVYRPFLAGCRWPIREHVVKRVSFYHFPSEPGILVCRNTGRQRAMSRVARWPVNPPVTLEWKR